MVAHRGLQIRGQPRLHSKTRSLSALNTQTLFFLMLFLKQKIKHNSYLHSIALYEVLLVR